MIAVPKAWFVGEPLTTLDLSGFVNVADIRWAETMPPLGKVTGTFMGYWDPVAPPQRSLYIDGDPRPIDIPAGATGYAHTDEDVRGGYFTYPEKDRRGSPATPDPG